MFLKPVQVLKTSLDCKQQTMNTAVLISLAPTPSKLKVGIKDILMMEL